jgi:His-Xaa-Ser system radical SAM maturase HxsC
MCPQRISNYENTSLNMKVISLMDKNTEYLGLTGGEPTLLKDDLIKIIRECKHKLPKTTIALLTNGILLDDFDYIKELVSINHPNIIFQIPLYADNDTEHNNIMQSNSFYRTIKGIHNLALFNQKIEIRTVVHALNYRRLAKLSEFIYRNFPFVYHIAFMGLELEEKAKENINLLWIDPYEYRDKLRQAIMTLHRAHLNVSIYNHQLCILPEELWKYSEKSISIWKNEYLNICSNCDVKDRCGGLFRSCMVKHSDHLQPVKMSV